MTPLEASLVRQIRATGPMTVAEYMNICLTHPKHGYYTTHDPFGAAGDFVTAPEISQMFGELVGLALAQTWIDQGSPTPFRLVELGPGRGTMMADILRATSIVPGFGDAADIHLIETSAKLQAAQIDTIGRKVQHHTQFDSVPDGPIFLVANEFFDALPVRQFIRDGESWREKVIGLEGGKLSIGLTDPMEHPNLSNWAGKVADADVVEVCNAAAALAGAIGSRISEHGGAALIIDYGHWGETGDTLQAVRKHKKLGVLDAPGQCDLTAHVDFHALARAGSPAAATALVPQGVFLESLGISERAQILARDQSKSELDNHVAAHRRLTHPDEMGTLFQVMSLYPSHSSPPPGTVV